MSIINVVPVAAELSTATLPPWLSATDFTNGSPMPQPLYPRRRRATGIQKSFHGAQARSVAAVVHRNEHAAVRLIDLDLHPIAIAILDAIDDQILQRRRREFSHQ
jgi:hypothetical protein